MEDIKVFEVYSIKNIKDNNKVYVGATSQGSAKRFKQHVWKAESGSDYAFHKAIREFGRDAFVVETLEYVYTVEELKEREKYWIIQLRSRNPKYGYNSDCGGDIMFHTAETKAKISAIHKGKDMSKRYRAVLQYDLDGNFIQEFPSLAHACEFTSLSRTSLIRYLNKTIKTKTKTNNYIWFYKEELPEVPSKIDPEEYKLVEREYKVSEAFIQARKTTALGAGGRVESKPVVQLDLQGNVIKVFYSFAEASRQTGISKRTIHEHCSGMYKDRLNNGRFTYTWKYFNTDEITDEQAAELNSQKASAEVNRQGNNKKKVALYSNDEIVKVFDTLSEAAESINIDRSVLGKQLNKKGIRFLSDTEYFKFC